MRIVERDSGLEGILLRPLSAKLLPATVPEQKGWVDRARLLDLSGRSRTRQMALARELKIDTYPSPAGGCILTDEVLSKRIEYMLQRRAGVEEIFLCRIGRHFVWPGGDHLVVARNQSENALLEPLGRPGWRWLKVKDFPGPLGLYISSGENPARLVHAAEIVSRYSKARHETSVEVAIKMITTGEERILRVTPRWEMEETGCRRI
jgi:hypothetical protein